MHAILQLRPHVTAKLCLNGMVIDAEESLLLRPTFLVQFYD